MFRRTRRPKLSKAQIERAIQAVERLGKMPTTPLRGKPLGDAIRELDVKIKS